LVNFNVYQNMRLCNLQIFVLKRKKIKLNQVFVVVQTTTHGTDDLPVYICLINFNWGVNTTLGIMAPLNFLTVTNAKSKENIQGRSSHNWCGCLGQINFFSMFECRLFSNGILFNGLVWSQTWSHFQELLAMTFIFIKVTTTTWIMTLPDFLIP